MAEIAITKTMYQLQEVFDNPKNVYFSASKTDDINALATLEKQLPIIESQATINTGEASITRVKLTNGEIWASFATAGDPDIKLQVASIEASVSEIFMNKKGSAIAMKNTFKGKTYEGQGYDTAPKKVTGTLLYTSQDETMLILLPNVEIYASFNGGSGDSVSYFNLDVNPKANVNGVSIAFLKEKVTP